MLYSESDLSQFSKTLSDFITTRYPDKKIELSVHETIQLYYLYTNNGPVTPQIAAADLKEPQFFEIRRSLTRYMAFALLWNLAENFAVNDNLESIYTWFIQNQKSNPLTFDDFTQLLGQFRNLITLCKNVGGDNLVKQVYSVLRATCFFTKTKPTDKILQDHGIEPLWDSEKYLTQVAKIAQEKVTGIALIDNLAGKKWLPYAFLPMHLRALLFSEGPEQDMLRFFDELKTLPLDHQFLALTICSMRWLINLLGFSEGVGAPFYNHPMHVLTFDMLKHLAAKYQDADYPLITRYLNKRAELAGISSDDPQEQLLLGHLVACNAGSPIFDDNELGQQIKRGYEQFKAQNPHVSLANDYQQFLESHASTPTYTPALFSNALNKLTELKPVLNDNETFLQATAHLTCALFAKLYPLTLKYPEKIIASAELARDKLKELIPHWLANGRTLTAARLTGTEFHPEAAQPKIAVVVSLGELINTNFNATVAAFGKLLHEKYHITEKEFSEKWPDLLKNQLSPLIGQFRLGWIAHHNDSPTLKNDLSPTQKEALTEKRFQTTFCELLGNTFGIAPINFTSAEFNAAWCAMCGITQEIANDIVLFLQDSTLEMIFYSNTNSLQAKYIVSTLQSYEKDIIFPDEKLFLSFKLGKHASDLLAEMTYEMAQQENIFSTILYVFGDPKQIHNDIFRKVAEERMGSNSRFVENQSNSISCHRNKAEHPSCYQFVSERIAEIKQNAERIKPRGR